MSQGISKALMCVQIRTGVEIWVENERAESLQEALAKITQSKFIRFEGESFNTADIVGVFKASTMESATRRKNGQTQCKEGNWHDKGEKCECLDRLERSKIDARLEAIKQCGKCTGGFLLNEQGNAMKCQCLADIDRSV